MQKHARTLWLSALVLMTIMLTGCSNNAKTDELQGFPDIGIAVKNLNQHLKIITPSVVPSFRKVDWIDLKLENLSQSPILIDLGNGIKIFKKTPTGWEPVQNNINNNNTNSLIPVKGGDQPGFRIADIYPNLRNLSTPIILRVVVIGKPDNLPDVTNTISYVDITVNP